MLDIFLKGSVLPPKLKDPSKVVLPDLAKGLSSRPTFARQGICLFQLVLLVGKKTYKNGYTHCHSLHLIVSGKSSRIWILLWKSTIFHDKVLDQRLPQIPFGLKHGLENPKNDGDHWRMQLELHIYIASGEFPASHSW